MAATGAFLWLASTGPAAPQAAPAAAVAPPTSVAQEPLFADIVSRAKMLKAESEALRQALAADRAAAPAPLPGYAAFKDQIGQLSALDMQGHVLLKERGTDGDLKCILRGISQDLPVRLQQLEAATKVGEQNEALKELTYLLNDNVEVITAPPAPPV